MPRWLVFQLQTHCSLAGAILAAPVTNKIGRKYCLMLNCIFFLLGAAIMTASPGNLDMCTLFAKDQAR